MFTLTGRRVDAAGNPKINAVQTIRPTVPILQLISGTWCEVSPSLLTGITDSSGNFSIPDIPPPSQCDPSSVQWIFTDDEGASWSGAIPEAGVLTTGGLHDLGWPRLAFPLTQGMAQGDQGIPGPVGPAGPPVADATTLVPGAVLLDRAASGAHPIALTEDGIALGAGMFGSGALQTIPGNDARLTDARVPLPHHASHDPGASDPLNLGKVFLSGLASARPAAAAGNAGALYFATDTNVISQSNGTTWTTLLSGYSGVFSGEISAPDVRVTGIGGSATPMRFVGSTTSGSPISGTYLTGDVVLDRTGIWWLCTTAGSPGTWTQMAAGPPSGPAGGDLTGTYPGPTIGAGKVTTAALAALAVTAVKIANATITDAQVAAANKDGTAGTPSLRTLGTGAQQATAGNDARLSDARTPTTHATSHEPGGSDELFGLTDAQIAAANKDGVAGTASLRTLGTGAQQATAGNDTRLSNARTPTVHESTHEAGGSDAFPWSTINGSGTDAGKPAAGSTNSGYLWHATDTKKVYKSNGSVWSVVLDASGTGISTTLAGDTDVSLSSPVESDLLTFDTGTGKWRNRRPLSPNVDATVLEGDLLYRHNKTSLVVGFIGDSLTLDTPTSGLPPPNNAATDLSVGGLTVSQNNQGVSGTTSVTWLPTDISGNFTTAKAAFLSFGVSIVHIMLGTNDSRISERVTQAGYKANLAVICANLNAAGMICVLSYPPYAVPGSLGGDVDATSLTLLQQYEVAIDQLVNGTTIRQGDTTAYNYFAAHTSEFSDGVHPTATGSSHLGQFWATALTPVVTSDLSPLALGAAGTFLTSNGTAPVYRILATSDLPVGTGTRIAMQSGSVAPPVPLWTTAGDDYVYLTPGTP